MADGLDTLITRQELADLIDFLKKIH